MNVIDKISRAQSYLGKMFEQKKSSAKPQTAPQLTGSETIGPQLSAISAADRKTENGVKMIRYNGVWRKVIALDENNRLILE